MLHKDGWVSLRKATHGIVLVKSFGDRTRVTVIPNSRASLPEGTLAKILSPTQTDIGKAGLRDLITKHGL